MITPPAPACSGPLITVIVPIFNAERFLVTCLDSVLAQTYRALEILLVDDGSTDRGPVICSEYAARDARIRLIATPNGGPSSARNAGLASAQGGYVFFLDADDFLEPGALAYLLNLIEVHEASIACGGVRTVKYGKESPCLGNCQIFKFEGDEVIFEYFHGHRILRSVWNKLYTMELIRSSGASFDEELRHAEDALFNCTVLLQAARLVVGNQPTYNYIIHGQNTVTNISRNWAHMLKARGKMYDLLQQHRPAHAPAMATLFILDALAIVSDVALGHGILQNWTLLRDVKHEIRSNQRLFSHQVRLEWKDRAKYFLLMLSPLVAALVMRAWFFARRNKSDRPQTI